MRMRKGLSIDPIRTKLRVRSDRSYEGACEVRVPSSAPRPRASIANVDFSPAYGAVAPLAGPPERARVWIVLTMATNAIGCDLQARRILFAVAALAFQSSMRPDQRVIRFFPVIETPMRPSACVVTTRALRLRAKMALVVILVAALAGHRKSESGRILSGVAAFTFQSLMSACERIVGLARMIELPFAPGERIVTIPTLSTRAKAALVIAVLVTLLAGERRILIDGRTVAAFAGNRQMLAKEREACLIVIENDVLAPLEVVVASLAAIAELAFVGVLLFVAGDACYR